MKTLNSHLKQHAFYFIRPSPFLTKTTAFFLFGNLALKPSTFIVWLFTTDLSMRLCAWFYIKPKQQLCIKNTRRHVLLLIDFALQLLYNWQDTLLNKHNGVFCV